MKEDETFYEEIEAMMKKGERALSASLILFDNKDYDFAVSNAYYAVFHFIQALLLIKNLHFSKHAGVISAFNLYYIKEGIFDKDFSKYIERLFKHRQTGDYGYLATIDKETAKEDIEIAKKMVKTIKEYIKNVIKNQTT